MEYILEMISLWYHALFYAKLPTKTLSFFEKAFDSISWHFLHEVLNKVNFGPSMHKWVHLFYNDNDILSCVLSPFITLFSSWERL